MVAATLETPERSRSADSESGPEFFRPLVDAWLKKIEQAQTARKEFDGIANQCWSFYQSSTGFMWEPKYRNRYMNFAAAPKFKITLNLAFEYVSLYAPSLYWRNPQRNVKPRRSLRFGPENFLRPDYQPPPPVQPPPPPPPPPEGSPPEVVEQYQQLVAQAQQMAQQPPPDPAMQAAQQEFQYWQQQQAIAKAGNDARCQTLEAYLNYTPGEMPHGTLAKHAQAAITEALVCGRGFLMPRPYSMPGSKRKLTGCFYVPQKDVWWDPDATSQDTAQWMTMREVLPYWKVEKEFNLPKDSLKKFAQHESSNGYGERSSDSNNKLHRAQGKTCDLMVIYRIWSKMGVGVRLAGVEQGIKEKLDRDVGDYAHIVVSDGVPYPLNAPPSKVKKLEGGEEGTKAIRKMFEWPTPYWKDDKWPLAELKFYHRDGSPYPVSPLEPGLGELCYLNVFISHLAGRIWSSCRDIIAATSAAKQMLEQAMKSGDDLVIAEVSSVLDIRKAITFLQQPQVNPDAWRIIDKIADLFRKRVGLDELMYGSTATQSRSAEDANAKQQAISIRPDYMAGEVESWQTILADMEKFCARWHVEADDVEFFGPLFQKWWTQYVTDESPEITLREVQATVEAGSARKRNKQTDAQNIQAVLPVMLPELSAHANVTGETNPLNALIGHWGDVIDMDMDDMAMGPRVPKPPDVPPEQQQFMQQQQQLQLQQMQLSLGQMQATIQKVQAEAQAKMLEAQAKQAEMQGGGPEQAKLAMAAQQMQMKQAESQAKLQGDQQARAQEMAFDQQRFEQEMAQAQQKAAMEMQVQMAKVQADLAAMQQKLEADKIAMQMKVQAEQAEAATRLQIDRETGMAKIEQMRQQGAAQAEAMKQKAAAAAKNKPKPGGK